MKKYTGLLIAFLIYITAHAQTPLDTALDFSVKDIYGNKIELYELLNQDKFVVIDFFSTSCGPCGLYAPDFQQSYEDFGENEGNVFFLSICWGDDNNGVAYFDSVYGLTHPSVSGSQGGGNQVHNSYLVGSTPTVILINPDREIIEQHIWEPTTENINAAIIAAGGSMVSISDMKQETTPVLSIYPNPAVDKTNVGFESAKEGYCQLQIYNLRGQLIYQTAKQYFPPGWNNYQLETAHLKSGTYIVSLQKDDSPVISSRLIIQD